jgi:hypothetical protein
MPRAHRSPRLQLDTRHSPGYEYTQALSGSTRSVPRKLREKLVQAKKVSARPCRSSLEPRSYNARSCRDATRDHLKHYCPNRKRPLRPPTQYNRKWVDGKKSFEPVRCSRPFVSRVRERLLTHTSRPYRPPTQTRPILTRASRLPIVSSRNCQAFAKAPKHPGCRITQSLARDSLTSHYHNPLESPGPTFWVSRASAFCPTSFQIIP